MQIDNIVVCFLNSAVDAYKYFQFVTTTHSEYETKFYAYLDSFQEYYCTYHQTVEEKDGKLIVTMECVTSTGLNSNGFAAYIDKYITEQMKLSIDELKNS